MVKKTLRSLRLSTLLAAASLILAGCVMPLGTMTQPLIPNGSDIEESKTFSSVDIMFAQMMIPHHQQALDMSLMAAAKSQDSEILDLAATISLEQDPEIAIMRGWLSEAGASEEMGHAMHGMDGMLTEEQLAALLNAEGSEFDELFLKGMIAHHEGAISMAQMVIQSSNSEVRSLAESIVASQKEQIAYMKALLSR
jgi:uncharacterized protein (DUF305 family)